MNRLLCQSRLVYEARRMKYALIHKQRMGKLRQLRTAPIPSESDYSFAPFLETNSLFVHIPKCAGVAVSRTLFNCLSGGHHKLNSYSLAFNYEEYHSMFKFAFVRNPWSRTVSAYNFLRKGGMEETDASFRDEVIEKYADFEDFVMNWLNAANIYKKQHFLPQYIFLQRECGLSVLATQDMDFVGRFENLQEDFGYVAKRIGSEATSLPRLNAGPSVYYREMYSKEMKEKVERLYQEDVAIFEYEF